MIAPHSPRWPRVVAEALAQVARPLATVSAPLEAATPDAVVAAWQGSTTPALDAGAPPAFLLTTQHTAWRRCRAALAQWGGALLAEPVGTGKTWIALGVAATESAPILVTGPAILRRQWLTAAANAGVRVTWWSHERWSRGQTPPVEPALVIVDEAHRFRDPGTRRLATLAPWLSGRRTLLLTATPIVNRLRDLTTLLRLVVAEDALRLDGLGALGMLDTLHEPLPALTRLVIRTARPTTTNGRCDHVLPPNDAETARGARALAIVRTLTARYATATRRLLTTVLLDAAASSDAAFRDALRRYRALLVQASESGSSDRQMLRRFAGAQLDQLVWWDLVGVDPGTDPLPIEDLPLLDGILADLVPDDHAWLDALLALMDDDVPTICFTRHRATAALVRTALGHTAAWVTGDAAGIGPHRVPREAILAAFGPERATWSLRRVPPRVLIATDVAAEGLDLQAAGRLIHLDLPWTAVRLAQREGRLLRLGQAHARVTIVVRAAPPPIEAELRRVLRVSHKQSLAERWLEPLARIVEHEDAPRVAMPWAVVEQPPDTAARDLVCIRLRDVASERAGVMCLERCGGGDWQHSQWMHPHHELLVAGTHATVVVDEVRELVDAATRWALREAHRRGDWGPPRLVKRIHRLARVAAWHRDAGSVGRLDRVLRWSTAAPRLGDRLRLDAIASATDAAVLACDAPRIPAAGPYEVTPIGALLFRSRAPTLR